ncbi:MAG TPA: DUF882 domain-containing protein [Thermoanaerobaculia bacterium]
MTAGEPLLPEQPDRHRVYRGLVTSRQERNFNRILVVVVVLYAASWVGAWVEVWRERDRPTTFGNPQIAAAAPKPPPVPALADRVLLPAPSARVAPALTDAMRQLIEPLRGQSGELRFAPTLPGETVVDDDASPAAAGVTAPAATGIHKLTVEMNKVTSAVEDISIVTLVPRAQKRAGRIGNYTVGTWPWEQGGTPRSPRYAPPRGFIEVTRENQNFDVSEHFRLRDFLTKDQQNVWPKYLVLDPLLIDKLELTIQELQRQGVKVTHVHVMSGFRTPRYNHAGGNTAGRASLSRHMYGDAADVYVDNNRDGQPDDITGDGRVTVRDAERFAQAAEIVERNHRSLVGGIGVYVACCGHGPFTHVDVRGVRARWRGTGNG